MSLGLTKAAALAPLRLIDDADPGSWEFSAFSDGGEDGVIDYLTRRMHHPDHCFVEIGASDGIANNTAWLAIARRYRGLMVEADVNLARRARTIVTSYNPLVDVLELRVSEDNVTRVVDSAPGRTPDVLSLDVDGDDYYIARGLFALGVRPKVCVVEFNSAFGPDRSCTVLSAAQRGSSPCPPLYYGVSVAGWKRFFDGYGYRFVAIERAGVNAFFVDPAHFDGAFLDALRYPEFRENLGQLHRYGAPWQQQLQTMSHMEFLEIAG